MRNRWSVIGQLTLAALAACPPAIAQEAAPAAPAQPDPKRVAALVADLEGEDVKTIMAAFNELMEIGTPALKPLLDLGRRTHSMTTRVRIAMMGPEIIKRSKEPAEVDEKQFPWSQAVNGIALRLSVDREACKPGQVVRLRLDFRNVDAEPRPFAPLTLINLPNSSGGKVEGALGIQRPAPPRPGAKPPYAEHPLLMELKPGQVVTYRFRLNEDLNGQYKVMLMHDRTNNQRAGLTLPKVSSIDMVLPTGESVIQFTYYAASRGLLKDAASDLSATVKVKVKAEADKGDRGDS